jgi:hypothetical protein
MIIKEGPGSVQVVYGSLGVEEEKFPPAGKIRNHQVRSIQEGGLHES